MQNTYDEIGPWFTLCFRGKGKEAAELEKTFAHPLPHKNNTCVADYVWLPVLFRDGKPEIRWFDEWRIEDFD